VSLLTDALRLKEGRLTRKNDYPTMPPLGRPSAWRWILIVAVGCVFAVWLILHWEEVYVKVEELAGIKSLKPGSALAGKVLDGREAEANTKPAVSPPAQAVVTEPKSDKKTESAGKVVAEAAVNPAPGVEEDEVSQVEMRKDEGEAAQEKSVPAASTARLKLQKVARSESRAGANGTSKVAAGEGEKLSLKTTQASVAKKSGDGLGVKKPVLKKRIASAVAMDRPAVAEVPAGGLQPMKVELDEAGLVLEQPEEREKKRVDGVETFLRSLQVQGVRLQGKDSRIMVDGVAIGVGEKVGSMGLVLESVEPQKLIFSDGGGKKYPKSY
jgi:hypothetical protein